MTFIYQKKQAFTLVELLVVIGILSVLATAAVIVIDPAEMLRQTRDATRSSDLQTINKALSLYQAEGNDAFGASNTVYVSLPSLDDDTECRDDYPALPALPASWQYHCVNTIAGNDPQAIDGTGWIPVDLTSVSSGSPLAVLPVDPVNTPNDGHYYTYVGGSWKLTALFESEKRTVDMKTDNGPDHTVFEVGPDLSLASFARGLVGYWKFDETSGTTAIDSSGNGKDGTIQSDPVRTTGKIGNALLCNGNDYIDLPNDLGYTTAVSAFAWFKMNGTPPGNYHIIFGGQQLEISINTSGYLRTGVYTNTRFVSNHGSGLLDGQWHFVGFTFDGTTKTSYIDGFAVGTQQITSGTLTASFADRRIGRYGSSTTYYLNGTLDELRIYNRAISSDEVTTLYETTK